MMKIAVVGLGGVGGYLAACFAQNGLDVTGFGRGAHLRAIEQHGLRVVEDTQSWTQPLLVQTLQEAKGRFDLVMFCTKSYDLEEAYKKIEPLTTRNTIMLSFANGIDNGNKLRNMGALRVLDGCIYILSHIQEAGVIRKKGRVFAAVFGGETEAVDTLAALFEQARLRYKIPENIQEALWKKYIFISAFATLTSYYDCSIGAVIEKYPKEAHILLQEIADVAKVYGVALDAEIAKALQTATDVPYDSTTSMHKDFQEGKKVELESLSGFICNTQEVPTPLMCRYYKALQKKC
jgi:2-dehydropantoate 2-reductase